MINNLSIANIKYLRAIYDIGNNEKCVRNIEIAKKLNVSKPSVHTMISVLSEYNLIVKQKNGSVSFTNQGADIIKKYNSIYQKVIEKLSDIDYIKKDNLDNIALTILSQLNIESIDV